MLPLWAVHISDGLLLDSFQYVGWAIAGLLVALASYKVPDEEIPRIGLLTAAFFVASSLRVPLFVTSAHLLLTGLIGVVLGRRAPLAAAVGLFLQAVLLGHGGYWVMGVNICIMTIPALGAFLLFRLLGGGNRQSSSGRLFFVGVLTGSGAVLVTAGLNTGALCLWGKEDFSAIAKVVFVAHVPVAVVEGLILGTTVNFLRRVKPELLGIPTKQNEPTPASADVGSQSEAIISSQSHTTI